MIGSFFSETIPQVWADNSHTVTAAVAVSVAVLVTYLVVARLTRQVVNRVAMRGGETAARAETLWVMIRRLLQIAFFVVGILTVALVVGVPITPFLAVGSAVGVAIGFGAQGLVSDVIAGFFILAEDQYHIGDVIRIGGVSGKVEDIRLRVTVLRDLDGNVHYVQNGAISVTTNLTQIFAQVVLDIGVAYNVDVDRALQVLADELDGLATDPEWSSMISEPPEILGVNSLGDSAVVLRATVKVGADHRWDIKREALRRIKNRFDEERIEIPFPQITVHTPDSDAN